MRPLRLLLTCAWICCSLIAAAQNTYPGKTTNMIVRFKPGFKPHCNLRHDMIAFNITSLDVLSFRYQCVAAKKLGCKGKHNPTPTYLLRFKGTVDINRVIEDYKATNYFELAVATKRKE